MALLIHEGPRLRPYHVAATEHVLKVTIHVVAASVLLSLARGHLLPISLLLLVHDFLHLLRQLRNREDDLCVLAFERFRLGLLGKGDGFVNVVVVIEDFYNVVPGRILALVHVDVAALLICGQD